MKNITKITIATGLLAVIAIFGSISSSQNLSNQQAATIRVFKKTIDTKTGEVNKTFFSRIEDLFKKKRKKPTAINEGRPRAPAPPAPNSCHQYEFDLQWGSNGWSNPGEFVYISGLSVDTFDNVYVSDQAGYRVQKFDSNGNYISQIGGIPSSQIYNPYSVSVDNNNNVYISDSNPYKIQKFDSNGNYITQWGTQGSGNGQFILPMDAAVDSNNNIYVVDLSNYRIQKFDSNGNYITQWGTQGSGNGQFSGPSDIAIDQDGYVYVADTGNYRIQKFDSNGNYITQWGTQGSGNGQFSGNTNYLSSPYGIGVDPHGDIFVTDGGNYRIQKFDSNGNYITQWGTQGSGNGQFSDTFNVVSDSDGNIYVADRGNYRIQKFKPDCGGDIIITKDAQPNTNQDFTFSRSFGSNFILDDDSDPFFENIIEFNNLLDGQYTISELSSPGYVLSSITCDDPSGGTIIDLVNGSVVIDLVDEETITCNFVNEEYVLACIVPPSDMISWWTGDMDASDHLSLNNGALQNGVSVQAGKVENSLYFDGVDDYVRVANGPSLTPSTNEFTYDFWLKTENGVLGENALIYKDKEYSVWTQGENIIFEVVHPILGVKRIHSQDYTFPYDQWNFIAVTYNGADEEMKIFVNGEFVPTLVTLNNTYGAFPSSIISTSADVNFGMKEIDPSTAFKGYMDEIEYFDRVLSASELEEIYISNADGKCK